MFHVLGLRPTSPTRGAPGRSNFVRWANPPPAYGLKHTCLKPCVNKYEADSEHKTSRIKESFSSLVDLWVPDRGIGAAMY